jgi:hypothetical protein
MASSILRKIGSLRDIRAHLTCTTEKDGVESSTTLTKIADEEEYVEERANLSTTISSIKHSAEGALVKTTVDQYRRYV